MRRLEPGRDAFSRRGRRRHRREATELDPTLGAGALGEYLAVLLDLVLRDAEGVRGETHGLRVQLARCQRNGAAAHDRGTAGERADALADPHGVTADHRDIFRRDAELARGDLGERRLQPLPL